MKKPSSRIREEIAKLQEQLKHAETREAERIGRVALRAGLGEIEIEEVDLQAAFEELAKRFRADQPGPNRRKGTGEGSAGSGQSETVASGAASGITPEA
ncbi:conjugal transfer protein TraC [Neorhizobium sp. BT27B]|uniref:conjugal transfer protein TraC n=1 Tax=Neorhizobium sp. BT27B TaxID=3142625 RepID=UPI003D2672D5